MEIFVDKIIWIKIISTIKENPEPWRTAKCACH